MDYLENVQANNIHHINLINEELSFPSLSSKFDLDNLECPYLSLLWGT